MLNESMRESHGSARQRTAAHGSAWQRTAAHGSARQLTAAHVHTVAVDAAFEAALNLPTLCLGQVSDRKKAWRNGTLLEMSL